MPGDWLFGLAREVELGGAAWHECRRSLEANEARSYHALHVLNTRPAINYLAKVQRVPEEPGSGEHHAAAPARRPENA